jgi:hypothetical protein
LTAPAPVNGKADTGTAPSGKQLAFAANRLPTLRMSRQRLFRGILHLACFLSLAAIVRADDSWRGQREHACTGPLAAIVRADDSWPAFTVKWSDAAPSPADVSFLLNAPADKDGHLVRPGGQRFRIWGINATAQGALPATASAPVIAARLARLGINCVRSHFLDRPKPGNFCGFLRRGRAGL